MAEQHRWAPPRLGCPVGMGVATAADQAGHRQPPGAGGHIQGHRRPLGEAEQHRLAQAQFPIQGNQPLAQLAAGDGQLGPARLLQVVPLPPHAGRVGQRGLKGHHAHLRAHQQSSQLHQVVGVRSPAVQQHQALAGCRRTQADQADIVGAAGRRDGHTSVQSLRRLALHLPDR